MKWINDPFVPNQILKELSLMPFHAVSVIRTNLLQNYDYYKKSFDIWEAPVYINGGNGWCICLHYDWELNELLKWLA